MANVAPVKPKTDEELEREADLASLEAIKNLNWKKG